MSRRVSVTMEAVETLEFAVYDMETYQLTQEDETLDAVHRLNAIRARTRPQYVSAHDAQRRAARLSNQVAKYEVSLPELDSRTCRDGARSHSCPALGRTCGDASFGGDCQPCGSERNILQPREADVSCRQSGRRWTAPTNFWKRDRHAGTRVAPESAASEAQSYSGHQQRLPQSSRVLRKLSSMMRRSNHEKHNQKTEFDSLFQVSSSGKGDGHVDSFYSETSRGTSHDFDDEPVGKGDTLSGCRKSSLMLALGKGVSGFKAVVQKQRASASAEVRPA
eukprot:TRINITY_DN12129_c0_g3_i3.p1 TRINITY_DN12129_c0_g3~~TRINITY_DN12129_c0_g3_i3.p1  ORF type:complete len:278 (-),score=18.12 TRINITY_DN12129_c0_g3_i3:836-1669(-)